VEFLVPVYSVEIGSLKFTVLKFTNPTAMEATASYYFIPVSKI